jgi:SH3-like domain-containing protein
VRNRLGNKEEAAVQAGRYSDLLNPLALILVAVTMRPARTGRFTILLYQMDGTTQSIGRAAHPKLPLCLSRFPWRGSLPGRIFLVGLLAAMSPPAAAAGDQSDGSGLPLPRFASLKSDHVNVRGGPNKDHDVAWIYTRPSLPVEITAEFENWRKIRDRDGSEYHTLLSGKRTAYVAQPKPPPAKSLLPATRPVKSEPDLVPLHASADGTSPLRAMLEPGVLGAVKRCNGQWCRLTGAGFDGWIEQSRLWGVYPNEKIE